LKIWLDEKREKSELALLDGSFSTELQRTGVQFEDHPGWTAYANFDCIDKVRVVYEVWMKLGCEIITTNTYHHSIDLLRPCNGEEEIVSAFQNAVNAAHDARSATNNDQKVRILVSIGSYATKLRDGSEYTGAYAATTPAELVRSHTKTEIDSVNCCIFPGIIFETIPTMKDVEAIIERSQKLDDVIVSLSLN
ncbi:hypothetical protein PENTCL1PPCAC_28807, partial [Pristionchus entomophagus]